MHETMSAANDYDSAFNPNVLYAAAEMSPDIAEQLALFSEGDPVNVVGASGELLSHWQFVGVTEQNTVWVTEGEASPDGRMNGRQLSPDEFLKYNPVAGHIQNVDIEI